MKRLLSIALLALTLIAAPLTLGASASAVEVFGPCSQGAASSAVCTDANSQGASNQDPIVAFIKVIIKVVALIVGIASVIILIVSGLRLVSSAGDAQGVASARSGITYAVIGLIIALAAEALVSFVLNKI